MSLLIVVSGWVPFLPAVQEAYASSGDVDFDSAVQVPLNYGVHSAVSLPGGKTGYLYSDAGHTTYQIIDKTGADVDSAVLDSQMGADAGSPDAMKVIYLSGTQDTLITWEKEGSGNFFIVLDSSLQVKTTATAIDDDGAVHKTTETTPVELSNGNVVFMWFVADDSAFYMSIMNPDSSTIVAKTAISDNRDPAEGAPNVYSIGTNHNGTFMVVSRHYQSASPTTLYSYDRATIYNNDGSIHTSLFNLNASANMANISLPLQVIGLSDGNYAALFVDGDNLTIQEFDSNGAAVGTAVIPTYDEAADGTGGLLESASSHFLFYRIDSNLFVAAAEVANDGSSISAFNGVIEDGSVTLFPILFSGYENHIGIYDDFNQLFVLHGVASAFDNSTISPTTATFDKNTADTSAGHYQNVTTTATLNGNTLSSIVNGVTPLISGTDYTLVGSTITIDKAYLAAQANGPVTLTLNFSAGATQTLTITVSDSTPSNSTISPTTATFDKNTADTSAGHYQNVTTTVTLNGNTLSSIVNGVTPLISGTDYTLVGSTITISKDYLAAQANGPVTLTLNFSAGATQTLTITVSDSTPSNSTISPTTATFDKNTADTSVGHYQNVTTTVTLNGNTLSSIVNGVTPLISGTDYTLVGSTITISKDYLAAQANGPVTLTLNFNAGATQTLTITVSDSTPSNSTISPTTATFDKNTADTSAGHYQNVTTTATLNGNTLSSIVNGVTPLISGTDYTLVGSTITIDKAYLAAQANGPVTLTLNFSAGATQTLTITVSDSTPSNSTISPTTATFDKNTADTSAGHYQNVTTTVTLNGNTLSSIVNGVTPLISGTDYTLVGSTITIDKAYLAAQANGPVTLTLNFSAGATQTLTITVSDSTPGNSTISPTTATFDKNTADTSAGHYQNVITTVTLNGNTLSSIVNGVTPLISGTDYTLVGSTITIDKAYLAAQANGPVTLTLNFNAGATQTLTITVSDSTPSNSTISPTTATFDKNTADTSAGHYQNVITTVTLNGNTLSSIVNGVTPLISGTDYTLVGSTITIDKAYLAAQANGPVTLTLNFNAGATQTLTITVSDSTPSNSTISPTTATFDKNTADTSAGHYQNVTTTVTLNGNTLSSIVNGVTPLISGTDYTLVGSTITISKDYLAAQTNGPVTLTLNFNAGATQTLTITVSDSTPSNSTISPTTATFDKNTADTSAGHYQNVTTTVTLNGNTLSSIVNGVTPLVSGTDYTLVGSTITISKDYLAAQTNGPVTLTLNFNAGATQTLTITVSDSSLPAPDAPVIQLGTTASGRANLTWAGVSGATSYKIFKSMTSGSYGAALDTVTGTTYSYTAQGLLNGTPYYFIVKSVGPGGDSAASNEITVVTKNPTVPNGPATGTGTGTPNSAQVLVNGKPQDAGTITTEKKGNQTVTVVTLDPKKLDEKLAAEGQHAVVTIPVTSNSDIVIGELDGQMVKNMEQKQAVVEIKTDQAVYTLPAGQINISAVSQQLGTNVNLQDIKVHIEIAKPVDETLKVVRNAASQNQLTLVAQPLDFNISGTYAGKSVDVSQFNTYVERTIALPDGVDPQRITTGVVIDPDGTVRHVPTKIIKNEDGSYAAKVKSLTNSTYSVVWHPVAFKDVASHWSQAAVNDMGSRLVISGIGNDLFNPDQNITRAEFAAIVVRGLGLKLEAAASPFSDVHAADWYNSAVQTAYAYDLISGFEDGTFRPMDAITREQAMTIISKAMKLAGISSEQASTSLLNGYQDADQAAAWAASGIAECLQAGIVSGRSDTELAPKAFVSRAEVAALVQRLLQKSDLI
ncbi:S-layer homology domain-containing protein [Paenibacillus athensensis]|nr:X2-like carbohydrate binding domain-containing protein [Paenibacillus athensensis]MCD1259440.1 S-layer homology domain-containing protein [Paenibacillus athensensis]